MIIVFFIILVFFLFNVEMFFSEYFFSVFIFVVSCCICYDNEMFVVISIDDIKE